MTEQPHGPRESLLPAIVIPAAGLAFIGFCLWFFSRVLLQLSATAATATALAVAVGILGVAAYVASRRQVGNGAVLSMIGGVFGVAMLAGGVALLVGRPGGGGEGPVLVALTAPEGAATNGYADTTLKAPANVPFTIAFDNQDPGVTHNVELAEAEGDPPFFEGQIVAGPAQVEYPVDPLAPADYVYYCVVHPTTMTGILTVAEGAEPGPGGGEGPPTVVARDLAFDTDTITLPADIEVPLVFDNEDPATTHNIAIYTDDAATESLFVGETFEGVAEQTYTIPPLAAGEYYFRCDVHTNMNGTVVVEAGGGGPGEGQGGGGGGGGGGPPSESPGG